MEWDAYDVSISSLPWVRPKWERTQRVDNASEAFREFRAAIDHSLGRGEGCDVHLVARAGRTALTLGSFRWSGAE